MKITDAHLAPDNFRKMNCSLATQIFSHSVASAIKSVVISGELKSKTALNTAEFVEFVNNLFDCLNSKEHYSRNPYACALSEKHPLVKATIEDAITKMENLFKITKKGNTRPACFETQKHRK